MRSPKLYCAAVALTAALLSPTALADHHEAAASEPVAVVNGQPIDQALFEAYAQQRQRQVGNIDTPEAREALLEELVTQELLIQAAREQKLDEDPEVVRQLALIERNLLAAAAWRQALTANRPTQEQIEAEYQRRSAAMDLKEYKARHILVASEEEARSLIERLDAGEDFAELAAAHSSDTSAAEGGDLGWFTADVMVEPFAQGVMTLEKDAYTATPVRTRFGWHVIRLDDTREGTPPSLEEMRPQIDQALQSAIFSAYLQELREAAEVEMR